MITIFILATFILHLYYDWNQGPVAEYKCKQWWIDHNLIDDDKAVDRKKSIYDHDYECALSAHAWLWSFLIVLPGTIWWYKLGLFNYGIDETIGITAGVLALAWVNALIHKHVDDAKANIGEFNLWTDQIIHVIQVVLTIALFIAVAIQNAQIDNIPLSRVFS